MKELKLWQFILNQLVRHKPVVFICVVESIGSSPGRQGFKMAVTKHELCGSIGGGIMEHKFVETAKEILKVETQKLVVKKQVHSKNVSTNQSGMICSGEQTLVVYPVKQNDLPVIQKIVALLEKNQLVSFQLSQDGFLLNSSFIENKFEIISDTKWKYSEQLGFKNFIHIIGGGHVSLAFSKLMHDLNFHVSVYDDRRELNTMEQNIYAHKKNLLSYEEINSKDINETHFVVIMTTGYRTDGIVLRKLIDKKFRYLGLLGSKAKVDKMLQELKEEGIDESVIKSINAPVGIQINSQTPEEIAVSIAAEIIKLKNNYA